MRLAENAHCKDFNQIKRQENTRRCQTSGCTKPLMNVEGSQGVGAALFLTLKLEALRLPDVERIAPMSDCLR